VPVPRTSGPVADSRIEVPKTLPDQIVAGQTTRADVLRLLGEPDGRGHLDGWFTYGSHIERGGVGWLALYGGPGGGGGVAKMGDWETVRRATIHFDDEGVVTNVDVTEQNCTQDNGGCLDVGGQEMKVPEQKALAEQTLLAQLSASGDQAVVAVYRDVYWYPHLTSASTMKADAKKQSGTVAITEASVGFMSSELRPGAAVETDGADVLRIPYSDIVAIGLKGASMTWFSGFCAVTITQRNGRNDWFAIIPAKTLSSMMSCAQTRAAGEALRSAVQASRH